MASVAWTYWSHLPQDFCSSGSFFVARINVTIPSHYMKELSKRELRNRMIGGSLN